MKVVFCASSLIYMAELRSSFRVPRHDDEILSQVLSSSDGTWVWSIRNCYTDLCSIGVVGYEIKSCCVWKHQVFTDPVRKHESERTSQKLSCNQDFVLMYPYFSCCFLAHPDIKQSFQMLTRLGKYNKLHILPHKSSFYFFYINRQLIIHNKSKFSTRCHLFRMLYEETDSRVSVALLLSTDSTGVPTSAAITSFISKQYKKNTS